MSSRIHSRVRALRHALALQWARLREDPRRLPEFIGKAWRVASGGRLRQAVDRHALETDWFAEYPTWIARYEPRPRVTRDALLAVRIAALEGRPRFGLVLIRSPGMSPDAVARTRASLHSQLLLPEVVVELRVEKVDGCLSGLCAELSVALPRLVACDFVGLIDSGDTLAPETLARLALELAGRSEIALVYTDHDIVGPDGERRDPDFKTAWDPLLFLQQNYIGRLWLTRIECLERAFAVPNAVDSEWDLLWRIVEPLARGAVAHLPRLLYRRNGDNAFESRRSSASVAAAIDSSGASAPPGPPHRHAGRSELHIDWTPVASGVWRARPTLAAAAPRVSIIVPTRNQAKLLAACIGGVLNLTRYPDYELVIVDNGNDDPNARETIRELGQRHNVTVVSAPGPFNFSHLNNRAAEAATGSILCFLNDDTRVIEPDWLDEMVSWLQVPDVGMVGARLVYADGTIQHSGVLLGAFALTHHLLRGRPGQFPGYHDRGRVTHAVSAVTAACSMIQRVVFESAGCYDEQLPEAYNDVDLCLKVSTMGRYNVVVNRPLLHHFESRTRGLYWRPDQEHQDEVARAYILEKWGERVREDPFYNPNLAVDRESYSLAFPPRVPEEGALRV